MRKLLFVALCMAVLGGVACADSGTADLRAFDAQTGCSSGHTNLETLDLTVSAPTGPLVRGTQATFDVKVVRRADIDSQLAADLPPANSRAVSDVADPTELPAEGVNVALYLAVLDALPLGGRAVTDGDGVAAITVNVKRNTPTGTVDGTALAWREVAEGPCAHIVETGIYHQEEMATIK